MSEEKSLEEQKAEVLIKLRGYKLIKKEKFKNITSYLVKIPKEKKKMLIWCIPEEATVGIQLVNKIEKTMKDEDVEKGILITRGKYTHTARLNAKNRKIELLPKNFPAFNIFKHELVPKHEILTEKERKELLAKYRIQPYQLPKIKASDPAVKAIGAKPGDILRVIRKSSTAGEHVAYRYVID